MNNLWVPGMHTQKKMSVASSFGNQPSNDVFRQNQASHMDNLKKFADERNPRGSVATS